MDALIRFAFDAEQGKIAHWFQEHCDRTHIFAKRPVILEIKGKRNADSLICDIADDKRPEHDFFHVPRLDEKKR